MNMKTKKFKNYKRETELKPKITTYTILKFLFDLFGEIIDLFGEICWIVTIPLIYFMLYVFLIGGPKPLQPTYLFNFFVVVGILWKIISSGLDVLRRKLD